MSRIPDFGQLLRERLDRVGGREEGGFDVVLLVELEQPANAYGGAVDTARDIGRVLGTAVTGIDPGSDNEIVYTHCASVWEAGIPVRYRINVDYEGFSDRLCGMLDLTYCRSLQELAFCPWSMFLVGDE